MLPWRSPSEVFSCTGRENPTKRLTLFRPLLKKAYKVSREKILALGTPFAVSFEEIFLPLKTHQPYIFSEADFIRSENAARKIIPLRYSKPFHKKGEGA